MYSGQRKNTPMSYRTWILILQTTATLLAVTAAAFGFDQTKYPDLRGQWVRGPNTNPVQAQGRGNIFDPSKGWGPAQEARQFVRPAGLSVAMILR